MPNYLATKAEFDEALKNAGSKLVVVDFTASWCGPCQMIAPKFEGFSETYKDVVFYKVDVDQNTATSDAEQIEAMPTFIFYKSGKKVDKFTGANAQKLEEMIKRLKAITLLQSEGPALGIHINMSKCEVFSSHSLDLFPLGMISSEKPNLVILGAPIGNKEFCSSFVSKGLKNLAGLWSQLEEDALAVFDAGIRGTFCLCTGVDASNDAWQQAQLSLGKGGLGLRSLSLHSPAAFIASVCSAGYGSHSTSHLSQAIDMFNCLVASSDVISVENLLSSCSVHQKALSEKLDDRQFNLLLNCSSVADRARLLSVSSPFAASWLSVIPSEGLGLHLTAPIFQVALKWWLGLDTSGGSQCSLCPGKCT
ncbi:hypothetical protein EMCRGX_G019137 [Ephydatia muelleri]